MWELRVLTLAPNFPQNGTFSGHMLYFGAKICDEKCQIQLDNI